VVQAFHVGEPQSLKFIKAQFDHLKITA